MNSDVGVGVLNADCMNIGSAIFCLLSQHMTVVLQRLEVPIPRKLATNSSAHEKVCGVVQCTGVS